MHTILGAGGNIGVELARQLTTYTPRIRLVARTPRPVNATDELMPADLLDVQHQSLAAVVAAIHQKRANRLSEARCQTGVFR